MRFTSAISTSLEYKFCSETCLVATLSRSKWAVKWRLTGRRDFPVELKQLLDEAHVMSGIIKVSRSVTSWGRNTYLDLDHSRHHKKRILKLFYYTLFWRKKWQTHRHTTLRLVSYLREDNWVTCTLRWYPKLTEGSWAMRKQRVSKMHDKNNLKYIPQVY